MNKRNRIFFGVLLLFALGIGIVLYTVAAGLDTRYRESAETTLVDTANILAAWIETEHSETLIDPARMGKVFANAYQRSFNAQIYAVTKNRVELRVYVTDGNGVVVFDSRQQDTGQDFRFWHDVNLALAGRYGARTTRSDPQNPETAVMYVTVPLYQNQQIIGTVSVGKAVASHHELVVTARQKLIWAGLIAVFAFLLLLIIITIGLTSPTQLTRDLIQIFKQERLTQPKRILRRIGTVLKNAFWDMRDAMAGRSYTEDYMQSLTHELKSPLTAIRSAAELLREPMPDAQRAKFTDTITLQVQRLQDLADRLLELTSLEKRHHLEHPQKLSLNALIQEAQLALASRAQTKNITLICSTDKPAYSLGDSFLLQRALTNLLENALDFSEPNSNIQISIIRSGKTWQIQIRDHGPGIPDYALDRLFEKFYSLRRPDSGQKSTGLGLPFVREIAHLHGGEIILANHPDGGALATLSLPSIFG